MSEKQFTYDDLQRLKETVETMMGDADFTVNPSPVRAYEVGTLLSVLDEYVALRKRVDAALAIEEMPLSLDDYQRTFNEKNCGFNVARDEFRKALDAK